MTRLPEPSIIAAIRQELGAAQRILVVSHIRPDGDAVGPLLGLGLAPLGGW
jgi:nanoRNase/pAp phosphatase (c-di-AMP/oligoRNAs hydrolase)